jgi:hypothetical protein
VPPTPAQDVHLLTPNFPTIKAGGAVNPDPSLSPLDRTEVVQLTRPGKYLVICGFLFHFLDDMFGHIKVLP